MTGGLIINRTLAQSIVGFEDVPEHIRVQLGDGDPTLDDLADEERQQVRLGHLCEKPVILTTQVVAIVRQHSKTNVLRYHVTGIP